MRYVAMWVIGAHLTACTTAEPDPEPTRTVDDSCAAFCADQPDAVKCMWWCSHVPKERPAALPWQPEPLPWAAPPSAVA